MSDRDVWYVAVLTTILFIMTIIFLFDYSDCEDKGGKLVEGVFWFECVNVVY
jgi:hypothetical protein